MAHVGWRSSHSNWKLACSAHARILEAVSNICFGHNYKSLDAAVSSHNFLFCLYFFARNCNRHCYSRWWLHGSPSPLNSKNHRHTHTHSKCFVLMGYNSLFQIIPFRKTSMRNCESIGKSKCWISGMALLVQSIWCLWSMCCAHVSTWLWLLVRGTWCAWVYPPSVLFLTACLSNIASLCQQCSVFIAVFNFG